MAANAFQPPILLLVVLLVALMVAESSRPPKATYTKASFVPPAAPSLASSSRQSTKSSTAGWPSAANHPSRVKQHIATGYGTYHTAPASTSTSLLLSKKKGGGGATQPVSKKGKIQVLLLGNVPNIGQSGDIVFVSSAVFQNQLKKQNKARLISEEEVQKMNKEKEEEEQKLEELAMKTKDMLEEAMVENLGGEEQCETSDEICGVALEMRRKAGPEGNLFGGINAKLIMDQLKEKYPKGHWDGKNIKLTELKDMEGKEVNRKDIKHIGEYSVTVSLGKDVETTFILSILAE